jgi:uncharacterized protein YprB with RNaseH-like and TPR domain
MLKRTFLHLPGVGRRTEAHFWRRGLLFWEDFLGVGRLRGFSPERLGRLKRDLEESLAFLHEPRYFASRLPGEEHWRLWRHYRPRAAYLDIETTGAGWPGLLVTVVGLYDGQIFRQFLQGVNLEEFPAALRNFDLLITYNGTQFDLPVLRAYFPGLVLPPVHLDLRFLLARLGYRGGLKGIEPQFGITRPPEVAGMDGFMAVILWEHFQRGDRGALELLLTYNREDVLNLELLMERAFELYRLRLLERLPGHPRQTPASL